MEERIKELLKEEVYSMDNPRYKLMHVLINLKAEYNIDIRSLKDLIQSNLVELRDQKYEVMDNPYLYEGDYGEASEYHLKQAKNSIERMTENERIAFFRMIRAIDN